MAAREPYAQPALITINTAHKMMEVVTKTLYARDNTIKLTHTVTLSEQRTNTFGVYAFTMYRVDGEKIHYSWNIEMMLDMRDNWNDYVTEKTNKLITMLQEK